MISVKLKPILAILLLLVGQAVFAEGVPFIISSASIPPSPDDVQQTSLISRLKHQAVVDYLVRLMGNRLSQHESTVTPEFTEKFVLDYKVNRSNSNRNFIELSGHLDGDALKRWVRVTETKAAGSTSLKPAFVLSSSVPGISVQPRETGARVRDLVLGQTLFSMMGSVFQKVNAHLTVIEDTGLSLSQPPRTDREMKSLHDFGISNNRNSVAWVNLSPCKGCGTRVDFYLYNLSQSRLVLAKSEQLQLDAKDFSSAERIRGALREPIHELVTEFDDTVSSGSLFSAAYRVIVDGIDSYRSFKQIEQGLSSQDFIVQASLKRSESAVAEFEVLSPLSAKELSQHFTIGSFPGFELKPVRVDSQNVFVRYSK